MIGEGLTKTSLVTANGSYIGDLTRFVKTGLVSRKKNDVSTFDGTFTSDYDSWPLLRKAKPWATYIRVERDGRDQWEGPITTAEDGEDFTVLGSDMGAYWKRSMTPTATYTNTDVTLIAADLIDKTFHKAVYGNPLVNTSVAGSLLSREFFASEYQTLDDAIKTLTGLEYYFFGRTAYFFGTPDFPKSIVKLTDESWNPLPTVELMGDIYANRVIIKGARHVGIAEAPVAETNYYGLITRRFDYPELYTQAAVDFQAKKTLAQTRDATYLNASTLAVLRPNVNVDLAKLVPGAYVEVAHFVGAIPLERQMRISEVQLDVVTSEVSISLEPLGVPDEETSV